VALARCLETTVTAVIARTAVSTSTVVNDNRGDRFRFDVGFFKCLYTAFPLSFCGLYRTADDLTVRRVSLPLKGSLLKLITGFRMLSI
jgi:hypothetical protein